MNKTKIEWTNYSWNPITGCTPISEGCRNCYAQRMAKRLAGRFGYPQDDPFKVTFHPEKLTEPFKYKKSKRIFVCSMGDLFHEDVLFQWLSKIWNIMFDTSFKGNYYHTYIILTKRLDIAKNFQEWMSIEKDRKTWYDNIWLGVSVENQKTANERIQILLQIPAAVRFVSCEPLLEKIDLYPICRVTKKGIDCIDWVIVGAETGPDARPMNPDWARSVRDQCKEAGVPFFFKQISKRQSIPDDLLIKEYPKT